MLHRNKLLVWQRKSARHPPRSSPNSIQPTLDAPCLGRCCTSSGNPNVSAHITSLFCPTQSRRTPLPQPVCVCVCIWICVCWYTSIGASVHMCVWIYIRTYAVGTVQLIGLCSGLVWQPKPSVSSTARTLRLVGRHCRRHIRLQTRPRIQTAIVYQYGADSSEVPSRSGDAKGDMKIAKLCSNDHPLLFRQGSAAPSYILVSSACPRQLDCSLRRREKITPFKGLQLPQR